VSKSVREQIMIVINIHSCAISDSHSTGYEVYCLMRSCDSYPSFEGSWFTRLEGVRVGNIVVTI
jgi:hypothetical protein